MGNQYTLNERDVAEFNRLRQKLRNQRGVIDTPYGSSTPATSPASPPTTSTIPFLLARLLDTSDDDDFTWSWQGQKVNADGEWSDTSFSGDPDADTPNGAIDLYGAIPDDIVMMFRIPVRGTDGDPATGQWAFVGKGGFWAKVTSSTLISAAHNRWEYGWTEQVVNKLGTFTDKPAGRTSGSTGIKAYNSIEANNSDSGTQGNSITLSDLPGGGDPATPGASTILPVQGSPVVWMHYERNCDGNAELYFSYENGVKPTCDAELDDE